MTRRTRFTILAGAAALAITGCGDDTAPSRTSSRDAATVGVESSRRLGETLVDSQGRTVYLFQRDTGPKSTCAGECAAEWPPVTVKGKPTVGSELTASQVGTTRRSDGNTQVTYRGHPLYRFAGDPDAGDVNGQGVDAFGALWYVVSPAGNAVTDKGPGPASGGNSPY